MKPRMLGMLGLSFGVVWLAAGCGRTEPKAAPAPAGPAALKPGRPAPIAPGARPTFALPDYAAQAKAQTNREQQHELEAKAQALQVQLPPKTR